MQRSSHVRCPDDASTCPTLRIAVAAMISSKTTYKYDEDLLRLIGSRMGRAVTVDQLRGKTYDSVREMLKWVKTAEAEEP